MSVNKKAIVCFPVAPNNKEKPHMLNIEAVNHIGVRVSNKSRSVTFYETLGFELLSDHGFEQGHPIVMRHPSGVVLNLLGLAKDSVGTNVLMDVPELYSGYTHIALTVDSLASAKEFLQHNKIEQTGSFSFQGMSAVFFRDPDKNVIELDAYDSGENAG